MIALSLAESWANVPAFEKMFWYVALPFTIFGLLSVIITIFGFSHSDSDVSTGAGDFHTDVPGFDSSVSVMDFFSVKNMIMFFAIFGWVGIVLAHGGFPKFLTVIVAMVFGAAAAIAFLFLFRFISRLSESGTVTSLESLVGELGNVSLSVPANRKGKGKVQILLHSALRELDAVTDGERLESGEEVRAVDTIGDDTLVVMKAFTEAWEK